MTDTSPFDVALFRDDAIAQDTSDLNAAMVKLMTGLPEWWVLGAENFRAARRRGEGPFPAPVMSPRYTAGLYPQRTPAGLQVFVYGPSAGACDDAGGVSQRSQTRDRRCKSP